MYPHPVYQRGDAVKQSDQSQRELISTTLSQITPQQNDASQNIASLVTSMVRLIREQHTCFGHTYAIELTDTRHFSEPIVFEFTLDSEGTIVEPDMDE
jgi:hypothetical protein